MEACLRIRVLDSKNGPARDAKQRGPAPRRSPAGKRAHKQPAASDRKAKSHPQESPALTGFLEAATTHHLSKQT